MDTEHGRFAVVEGESLFIASKILGRPPLLSQLIVPSPHGVLFAIPNRHLIAYHNVVDAGVLKMVEALLGFARNYFEQGPGSVSPDLFFWHGEHLQQITRTEPESHSIRVEVDGPFADALGELTPDD